MTAPAANYGALMDDARRAAHRGAGAVARSAFADADEARAALQARGALLAAIGRHTVTVIGPARVDGWRQVPLSRRSVEVRSPKVLAILHWIDALATAATRTPEAAPGFPCATGDDHGNATSQWERSRDLVEAGTVLVSTHHWPGGALRPHGPLARASLDPQALLGPAVALARVVASIEPLAARCRQAGMGRREVDRCLPPGDSLRDLTSALGSPGRRDGVLVADLTAANAVIDVDDPAREWHRRIQRIHQRLAHSAAGGLVSVRTLRDIAVLAQVTTYVLGTSGRRDLASAEALTTRWSTQLAYLQPLRSIATSDRVICGDVERLLDLAHPSATAHDARGRKRLLDAIEASVPVLDACADLADRLQAVRADAWIPGTPRRRYLPDLDRPGTRAQRAPAPADSWPRLATPEGSRSPGWSLG